MTLLVGTLAQAEVPKVLIVQRMAPPVNDVDVNLKMAAFLASAFDEVGQIDPIVWSNSDPVFRKATDEGRIPRFLDIPTDVEIRQVAQKLGCQGVLIFSVVKQDGQVLPVANLYRVTSGRPMWSFGEVRLGQPYRPVVKVDGKVDDKKTQELLDKYGVGNVGRFTLMVSVNNRPDWDSTARSIANTWVWLLRESVLKGLDVRPRMQDAESNPDALPKINRRIEITSDDPVTAVRRANELESQGDPDLAVLVLQDAIDTAPFDPAPRARLAELLFRLGTYSQAAEEAERAARLSPDNNTLWLLAAKSYVAMRETTKANEALNNARARGIETAPLFDLLGDVYLIQGDWTRAVEAYTRSISLGPRPKAIVGRAVANALLGRPDEVRGDLGTLLDANPEALGDVYAMAMELVEPMTEAIIAELREIPPLLRQRPKDPGLLTRAAKAQVQAQSLVALLEAFSPPKRHEPSHQGRLLAHKLLAQSSSELLDFAQTGNRDIAEEAVVSLGEAARLMPDVKRLYRFERRQQSAPR